MELYLYSLYMSLRLGRGQGQIYEGESNENLKSAIKIRNTG